MQHFIQSLEYRDLITAARVMVVLFGAWTLSWTWVGVHNVLKYHPPIALDWALAVVHIIVAPLMIFQLRSLLQVVPEYNDPLTTVALSLLNVGLITATFFRTTILGGIDRQRRYAAYQAYCDAITDLAISNPKEAEQLLNTIRERTILTALRSVLGVKP